MANKRISELPASGALTGAELVELVQGGINKQTTTQDIANLGGGGTSIPFGTTSGTNTYTIAATPAVTAYTDGMLLHVRVAISSTGLVTLNFDSNGAKKLLDTDGSQATDGYLKAGVDYIVTYNSALDSAAGAFTVVNEIQHGVMNLRGVFAASGGLYPAAGGSGPAGAIRHGDAWIVSGTDTIGSVVLRAGDFIFTGVDAPGQTASNWYVVPGYASVDLKAPLASPTFTGTPAAPTAAAATKTTQIATTAFVLTEMPYWVAASDEVTPITASDRITFPWPFPGTTTLVNVIGFLATPQTSGSIFTIDIEKNGTTILSTLLTIDNTEYNSSTAATAVVISVPSIAFLDRTTIVVTQIGDNTAKGLKLGFIR